MQKITYKFSSSLIIELLMRFIIFLKLLFYEEVIKLKIAVSALKVKLYKKRMVSGKPGKF